MEPMVECRQSLNALNRECDALECDLTMSSFYGSAMESESVVGTIVRKLKELWQRIWDGLKSAREWIRKKIHGRRDEVQRLKQDVGELQSKNDELRTALKNAETRFGYAHGAAELVCDFTAQAKLVLNADSINEGKLTSLEEQVLTRMDRIIDSASLGLKASRQGKAIVDKALDSEIAMESLAENSTDMVQKSFFKFQDQGDNVINMLTANTSQLEKIIATLNRTKNAKVANIANRLIARLLHVTSKLRDFVIGMLMAVGAKIKQFFTRKKGPAPEKYSGPAPESDLSFSLV